MTRLCRRFLLDVADGCGADNNVVLRYAVLGQQCTNLGYIAGLAQLVDPAGAEAKLGSHQQQILHRSSAVYQSVVLIPLVGNDNVDWCTVEIVLRTAIVCLSNGTGQLERLLCILNHGKVPQVLAHAGRRPFSSFNNLHDLILRRQLGLERARRAARLDNFHQVRHREKPPETNRD